MEKPNTKGDGPYKRTHESQPRTGSPHLYQSRSRKAFGFDNLDAGEVLHFIKTVTEHGDLCSFTLTSDGGALAIHIKSGERGWRSYGKDGDEVTDLLHGLLSELYE